MTPLAPDLPHEHDAQDLERRSVLLLTAAPGPPPADALALDADDLQVLEAASVDDAPAGSYDLVVVAGHGGAPGDLAGLLGRAAALAPGGHRVGLLVEPGRLAAADLDPDRDRWSSALSGWAIDGVESAGRSALLLLAPAGSPQDVTGGAVLNTLLAAAREHTAHGTDAAPAADAPARPGATGRAADDARDGDADPDGVEEALRAELKERLRDTERELRQLRRRHASYRRSSSYRLARTVRRVRAKGLRGLTSPRALVAATVLAVVALALVVGLALLLGWVVDDRATGVVLTVVVVAGGLLARSVVVAQRRLETKVDALGASLAGVRSVVKGTRSRTREILKGVSTVEVSSAITGAAAVDAAHAIVDLRREQADTVRHAQRDVTADLGRVYTQVQAATNLFALVDVSAPVPPLRGWAVSPDALLLLVEELLEGRPRLVVECGSGSSTLWLSLVVKQRGLDTRVVSLEHDERFLASTRRLLAAHGVDDVAEVRHAPLAPTSLPGHATPWYDESALDGLDGIDLLFVDGPPEATGPMARFPAVPVLGDRLAPGVVVVLDDANGPAVRAAAEGWLELLPGHRLEHPPTEKGTAVLRPAAGRDPGAHAGHGPR